MTLAAQAVAVGLWLIAGSCAVPASTAFRSMAAFRGWSGDAAILVEEADRAGADRWYRLASGDRSPVSIPPESVPLTKGTPVPTVQVQADCDPGQVRVLQQQLQAYDQTAEKPPAGFQAVECQVGIYRKSPNEERPQLLWKGQRSVKAHPGETNFRYQEPDRGSAILSPGGRTMLVGWREADYNVFVLLPN